MQEIREFVGNVSQWENLKKDLDEVVLPYAVNNGAKVINLGS